MHLAYGKWLPTLYCAQHQARSMLPVVHLRTTVQRRHLGFDLRSVFERHKIAQVLLNLKHGGMDRGNLATGEGCELLQNATGFRVLSLLRH